MGLTHVVAQLVSLSGSGEPYEAEFLVDTGAVDCLAPRDCLIAAGIRPEGQAVYELASVDPAEYEYGFARVRFIDAETVTQVIFGPEGVEPILGVVALENTGFMLDPVSRTLKRLPAKPLK